MDHQHHSCNALSGRLQIDLVRQPKIPRPPNAFMLYANENRKRMARTYPLDSNKEISKRLGKGWKDLSQDEKGVYYAMAKKVDAEHKKKYPDYVYNPKEARIRKAMRDASRERAMGVAPSSRGGRRAQPWVVPEVEDQFMMTPSHGMRGVVGSPMCGTGFPLGNVGPGQFMQPMHPYNKHMHLMSHETNGYMQTNPMAQLQHQTDMWPQYHQSSSPLRTNQPDQFMLPPSQMPTYHHQPQPAEIPPHDIPPPVDKVKLGGEFAVPETPVSSPGANDQMTSSTSSSRGEVHLPLERQQQQPVFETKVEPANIQQADPYLYHENIVVQNPFEKSDSVKMKKTPFQDPPKYFQEIEAKSSTDDAVYHKEYIRKYVETYNCDALEIIIESEDGGGDFSYVTYPCGHGNQYGYLNSIDLNDLYFIQNCSSGMYGVENALNLSRSGGEGVVKN